MSNPFRSLVGLLDSLENDFSRCYERGDHAAASRVRSGLKLLKSTATQIRNDVQRNRNGRHPTPINPEFPLAAPSKQQPESQPASPEHNVPGIRSLYLAARKAKQKAQRQPDSKEMGSRTLTAGANRFEQMVQRVPHYVHQSVCQSYFTDEEASRLCSNMVCTVPRKVAYEFKRSTAGSFLHRKYKYELHFLANKALAVYGANVITFIYELKELDFADATAARFTKLVVNKSFDSATVDFPTITFTTAEFYEYSLVFTYDELLTNYELRNKPQLKIYSRTYGCKVGEVGRNGMVIDTLARASVKLDLFLTTVRAGKELVMRLGVANGNCLICGAELKTSASRRRGIGPDCLRRL